MEYILGSGSPRRKQLLAAIGIPFTVKTSDVDETPDEGLKDAAIALSLAIRKANALKDQLKPDQLLITADTIVWINNILLGKPANEKEAFEMLSMLNGNTHQVFTGVCLMSSNKTISFSTESRVTFKKVSDDFLHSYILHYRPYDKAGSYGAQECLSPGINYLSTEEKLFLKQIGQADLFEKTLAVEEGKHWPLIESIEGSYFNVMGLPIVTLHEQLKQFSA